MKKVFVITSGSYSDYGIYGVCSTRKLADRAISAAKGSDEYWASDANIEEWPLDELLERKPQKVWMCGMLLDDGTIVEPKQSFVKTEFSKPFRGRVDQYDVKVPFYRNRPLVRVSSTVSQTHANKYAAEQRQKWLRENSDARP